MPDKRYSNVRLAVVRGKAEAWAIAALDRFTRNNFRFFTINRADWKCISV
ncbi:hypothetical protein [Hoeflea marina]|nr:hypothetical protein [Hoeflea marina]